MGIFNEKIVYNKDLNADEICYVKSAGIVYPDPSYSITRENSDTVVAAYILKGTAYLECRDRVYTLHAGDCYIMPARVRNKIYSDKRDPHSMCWINVCGKLPDALIDIYFGDKLPIIASIKIDGLLSEIRELLKEKTSTRDRCALLLHEITLAVKEASDSEEARKGNNAGSIENQIESFIVNRLQEKFSVTALAEHFDMSVPKLIRLFHDKFGCTPYSYYLSVKVDIAKKMLAETNLTVEDIACRLNFLDRNHFAKTFQKKTGMTPSGYRKNLSHGGSADCP